MATTVSYPSVPLTAESWVDLSASAPGIANADVFYQNTGVNAAYLYFGGASAPAKGEGIVLQPKDSFQGNASKVWARGEGVTKIAFVGV